MENLFAAGIIGFIFGFMLCLALVWVARHYAEIDEENPKHKNQ